MKYTFDEIREKGLLLFEYVRGSKSQGLDIETSDTDTGGVFCMPKDVLYGMSVNKTEQIQDAKGDTVWYEVGRFLELLCSGNSTMLEALFVPEHCILYEHPAFKLIRDNRDLFVTKNCFNAYIGYATQQIEKARGLNKKIVNPVEKRKDILDFCYTFKDQGTEPFKDFLERNGLKAKYCGLVHLPNMEGMYGVYYDWGNHFKHEGIQSMSDLRNKPIYNYICEQLKCSSAEDRGFGLALYLKSEPIGYRGAMDENNDTTQLRLSSVEKGAKPICIIQYNENGFKTHCRQYKEYQEWVKMRNPVRYLENKEKEFDRKNMMHCARLLNMGIEIAKTGEVHVDRRDIDRDFLLNIRRGNTTYEEIMSYVEGKKVELKEAIVDCKLPEQVDKGAVDKVLVQLRKELYEVPIFGH